MSINGSVYVSLEWREKLLAAGFPPDALALGVADEILRKMPEVIWIENRSYAFAINKADGHFDEGGWQIFYRRIPYGEDDFSTTARLEESSSLANAAAAMFVFLAEQKLLP